MTIITRNESPISENQAQNFTKFWHAIFGGPLDIGQDAFTGSEDGINYHVIYSQSMRGNIAGTCGLTTTSHDPRLAGLGQVATDPTLRRSGIATKLCQVAVDDFFEREGQGIFLGTANPEAARIYHRLGWRKLASANVMVNTLNRISPEAFLVGLLSNLGEYGVNEANPGMRVPMIPLIVFPHDWLVLDLNVNLVSTRYAVQNSCLGLYRRYQELCADGKGMWFGARESGGLLVGLSSAKLLDGGVCIVDSFSLNSDKGIWIDLMHAATNWGLQYGYKIQSIVSYEDEEKQAFLEDFGFHENGYGEPVKIASRLIKTRLLELA